MKKLGIFTLCFLFVFLSIPSIHVNAEGSVYRVYTDDSVVGFFNDSLYDNLLEKIYVYDGSNIDKIYDALAAYTSDHNFSNYFVWYNSTNDRLYYYSWDDDVKFCLYCPNNLNISAGTLNANGYLISSSNSANKVEFRTCANASTSPVWSAMTGLTWYSYNLGGYYYYYQEASLDLISYSNAYLYMNDDTSLHGVSTRNEMIAALDSDNVSSFTNFSPVDLPYSSSDGSIVDPSGPEIESNENHMYFKDCDLGFCIPKNMTNFNSFGGAYVYCRYVVDDWVVNHISDYKVVVSMNSIVGGRQFGSSFTLPLDRDGCVTIPFNAFSTNEIVGFTTYINKTLIEQDFYKTFLYSLSNQQLQVMYQQKSFSQDWTDFVTGGSSNPLLAVVSPSNTEFISGLSDIATAVTQRFDPYKIRLQCYLIDNSENQSGTVARIFDLVTGNDDSVDTSGLTNDNPFEPDVTDPDYTPTVPGDNSTYPQIIINNGGTWTGSLDGALRYDPGYRELKEDIDADPDGNFTQYLAPFENNDAGGFIMGFINGMPTAMKTIFVSGFGVLTLLGIYRFIRRG